MKGVNYMDQIKIGKFISSKRKEKNITQCELAEMLGISDRAISKWENGVCMPDVSNIPNLCNILGITINDLFSGYVVDMKEIDKKVESNLLELAKQKEEADKKLLSTETFMTSVTIVFYVALVLMASFVDIPDIVRIIIIISAIIMVFFVCLLAIRIEQVAGYYECPNCHYKYIPSYKNVLMATHVGRTRKMICPKCKNKSWHKKIITK